jgi:hypothetical protein
VTIARPVVAEQPETKLNLPHVLQMASRENIPILKDALIRYSGVERF